MIRTKSARLSSYFKKPTIIVGLLIVAGLLVRFIFITKSSIWHDEGFSIMLASRNMVDIWLTTARDVHPPLYYELLHVWMAIFGTSELAVRSLSALCGVLVIPFGYLVTKKATSRRVAYIATIFLVLAPFLIRYSQEARMYGLLGVLLLLGLYCVMHITERPTNIWPYIGYTFAITAALYTHYFAILAIGSFWVYLVLLQPIRDWKINKTLFLSWRWWLANAIALLLFLPWLPSMISQLKRGQGLSWLQPTNLHTIPDTLWQFFTFTDGRMLIFVYWGLAIAVIAMLVWLWIGDRSQHKFTRLLLLYTCLPITIGVLISLKRPIFHERYFAFAAIGLYILLAIAIDRLARRNRIVLVTMVAIVCLVEIVGIRNVYAQSNHQLSQAMRYFNDQYQPNDQIISAELYTYFDGNYYNDTLGKMLLYTGTNSPNGYGESALIYDQNVYVPDYNQLSKGRVWLIGKTGQRDYYGQIPSNWGLLEQYQAGYSEIRLYQIQ